jgi:hypothetical protein
VLALGLLAGTAAAARAQIVVRLNDSVSFRLGALLQSWGDWTEDPNSRGYSQNFFLRRVRFLLVANVAPGVSIFYQTENVRLGNAATTGAKNVNTGFQTQDAFLEWKVAADQLMLDAGLFYTPGPRGVVASSPAILAFDSPTFSAQQGALTGSTNGRDWGVGLKGYLVGDRLEYRVGGFAGQRQGQTEEAPPLGPEAGSRNGFRAAARVQYNVFDTEKGYTYVGTNRGAKKILAIGGWGDVQGDFKAYGADLLADIPIGKDAVTAEADYCYFDGGKQFQQVAGGLLTPLLPKEGAFFAVAGYYFDAVKLQPFVRYERLDFRDTAFASRDQQRFGGGLNWYISGQSLKISAVYERIVPRVKPATALVKDTNHFAIQIQAFYF